MNLVIVESPAKCQKIQGFLGPGWKVVASMGHIRALEEDLTAVGLENDFEPRFHFMKDKAKAIAQLKESAQGVTKVYLAADDDREGEAIAYSVALLLKLPVTTTARAVFHEITEKAVKDAVAKPRTLDMNRVYAQQARAVLDMMIGYTISPLLWKHIAHALSAGRCQTPALRLVVDKEREITNFKVSSSWRIKGQWSALTAQMSEDLEDEESAQNYLENLHDVTEGIVNKADTRPWTEAAPHRNALILGPFDEIGHDQEIAGEPHLFDDVQFEIQPRLILGGGDRMRNNRQPRLQPCIGLTAQFLHLVIGELGQDGLALIGGKGATAGDLDRVFQGFWQVGEEGGHLGLGFEIMLGGQTAPRLALVNISALGDADHGVMGQIHRGLGEIDIVGGNQWQAQFIGQIDHRGF